MKPLTIGQVARRSGVGVETVRFYEREGLLNRPARSPSSGYRLYEEEVVARLRELPEVELSVLPGVTENVRFRMPPQLADNPG